MEMNTISHHYTAFFCGCFTVSKSFDSQSSNKLQEAGWSRENVPSLQFERNKYYKEFLEFCYGTTPETGCIAWQYALNAEGSCTDRNDKVLAYHIPTLSCYLLPFHIVIFSIEVTMDTETLDDMKSVAFQVRQLHFPPAVSQVLLDLHEALTGNKRQSVREIIEYGFKLKFFQIINTDADPSSIETADRLHTLYQLATLEDNDMQDKVRFCDDYVKDVVNEHLLSVYNNWDALALLDSFTIRAFQAEDFQMTLWCNEFFRMIYIQSLFQKFYLQHLNQRFRAMMGHRKPYDLKNMLQEFNRYERICQFHKVSYTFLPLLVDNVTDKGLEVDEERAMLTEYIEREEKRHQTDNEKLVNKILLVISGLAAFSAIWDICCLVNEIQPFDNSLGRECGYLTVSAALSLVIVSVLSYIIYKK